MSKSIFIYSKEDLNEALGAKIEFICRELEPDNIEARSPKIFHTGNVAYGISNPSPLLTKENDDSLLIGQLFEINTNWATPKSGNPDGSYVLFRTDSCGCEIVSDPAGSRTIWYFLNEQFLVASSSQRAIIMFLGDFYFNEKVVSWILSTGSLGPIHSWDKRIKRLPRNSSLFIERNNWKSTCREQYIEFHPLDRSDSDYQRLLFSAMKDTFYFLSIDKDSYALPLSGGYDSRAILFLLSDHISDQLKTVTWGNSNLRGRLGSDAQVSDLLAAKFGTSHSFFNLDKNPDPFEKAFYRFLLLGEGRIDHFSGYTDGFTLWKTLFENQIQCILRGDVGFSTLPGQSNLNVMYGIECALCHHYANLIHYNKLVDNCQELPTHLLRMRGETIETWRDRLYHEFRIPTVLAALTDLKSPYLEVINPLLSNKVLCVIRSLPDHLRSNKIIFKKVVESWNIQIPFAKFAAITPPKYIFSNMSAVELIEDSLASKEARSLLPKLFLIKKAREYRRFVKTGSDRFYTRSFFRRTRRVASRHIGWLSSGSANLPIINPAVLAFRITILTCMNSILKFDSGIGRDLQIRIPDSDYERTQNNTFVRK